MVTGLGNLLKIKDLLKPNKLYFFFKCLFSYYCVNLYIWNSTWCEVVLVDPICIDDVTYVYIQTALCWQNTVYVMFRRAKRRVVMVRLHTLSSWLPKHKGFARQYARESCYGQMVLEWRQRSHRLYYLYHLYLHYFFFQWISLIGLPMFDICEKSCLFN